MAKPPFANIYWFPIAALYSAIALPWSVAGQLGWLPAPPGLQHPWGHGHEMLFGFALAVVAGYTAGPQPKHHTFLLIGLWLLARITFWCWPASIVAALCNLVFISAIVWDTAPTYLQTAKKWRNKSLGIILGGLVLSVAAFHGANQFHAGTQLKLVFLLEGILFLSALMFFMGGRMIAPAIAGYLQKERNYILDPRVQPRFEGGILILLGLAVVVNVLPLPWRPQLLALLLFSCAALNLIRMLRWRPWMCHRRPDLLALLLGYCWLIAGWLLVAISLATDALPVALALHAITVGALGTLTLTVMARGRMHRSQRDPNIYPQVYLLTLLIALATLIRISIPWLPWQQAIVVAMTCWVLAFGGLFALLLWLAAKDRLTSLRR